MTDTVLANGAGKLQKPSSSLCLYSILFLGQFCVAQGYNAKPMHHVCQWSFLLVCLVSDNSTLSFCLGITDGVIYSTACTTFCTTFLLCCN